MVFIEVLVDLEQISLGVAPGDQRLTQGWKMLTGNHRDGAVYLVDEADGGLIKVLLCCIVHGCLSPASGRPGATAHRVGASLRVTVAQAAVPVSTTITYP
jgi:hypothetical protein